MPTYFRVKSPSVISEPMDEELVAINLESGCYYSMNRTAAWLWRSLDEGCSLEQASASARGAAGAGPDRVAADFAAFAALLAGEGLIERAEAEPRDPPAAEDGAYTEPRLEKFSDMQEMLLLDPIHEVGESGWPHKK